MRSTQLSCPHCGSLLNFGQDVAAGATVPCLICGRTLVAADVQVSDAPAEPPMLRMLDQPVPVATRPAPPTTNGRALLAGGIVFAGLAVLLIAGMSVALWLAFARRGPAPTDSPAAPPADLAQAPVSVPPSAPAETPAVIAAKPGAAGRDLDLADLHKPDAPKGDAPLNQRLARDPRDVPELPAAPTVPVVVVAGGVAGVDQERVDAAIERGVRYLKKQQARDGSWPSGSIIGYTALAGLTLLECKVAADDPSVVNAANYLRGHVGKMNRHFETYETALAILFLDRLGNPRDKVLIQGMALRLLAGQNDVGGWTYRSFHQLTPPEMQKLLVFLQSHRPPAPLPKGIGPAAGLAKQAKPAEMPAKQAADGDDPFKQLAELMQLPRSAKEAGETMPKSGGGNPADAKDKDKDKTVAKPILGEPPAAEPKKANADKATAKSDKPASTKKVPPIPLNQLPLPLQQLPVAQLNAAKGNLPWGFARGDDNSNTQFALMGLWAARRHDVPTEFALQRSQQRFAQTKNNDGGWGYHLGMGSKNTMTCVGLIGLAMGHGVHADLGKAKAKPQDAAIQAGLRALGEYIGTPVKDLKDRPPLPNLYFLWSVERVAMLYDLKTIGGKDWYGWGAQALLVHQDLDGHWSGGGYHAAADHTDTCFALLFLQRSNLVPDLTENLRLFMVIRDPDAK